MKETFTLVAATAAAGFWRLWLDGIRELGYDTY